MKNIVLSAAAVFAMSSFAVAGGDIIPVEESVVEVPEVVASSVDGFYVGGAYGYLNAKSTAADTINGIDATATLFDTSFTELMLQGGYKFNEYIAVEGRYWFGLSNTVNYGDSHGALYPTDVSVDAWGIYAKPMYPVTEAFNVYALLGYGSTSYTLANKAGNVNLKYNSANMGSFSWGLGGEYSLTENISAFVDYTNIFDSTTDVVYSDIGTVHYKDTINTVNIGVTYKF